MSQEWVVGVAVLVLCCACGGSQVRTTRHENGQLSWRVPIVDGEDHGPSTLWHENGRMSVNGYYLFGKRHGLFLYFGESGELLQKELFDNGTAVWTGGPDDALPRLADSLLADIHKAKPELPKPPLVTLALDKDLDYATVMVGVHRGDRAAISLDIAATKSFGKLFTLASFERSQVLDDNTGPSGSKYAGSLGGGYRFVTAGDYSGTISAKAGRAIAGDNLGGFVASALTSYNKLSGVASQAPNSTVLKFMLSGRRRTDEHVLRLDLGLTPAFSHNTDSPQPIESNQLWGHLEASAGFNYDWIVLSAAVSTTTKIGSAQSSATLIAGGVAVEFEQTLWRPRIEMYTPLDDNAGQVLVIAFGFGVGLEARDSNN